MITPHAAGAVSNRLRPILAAVAPLLVLLALAPGALASSSSPPPPFTVVLSNTAGGVPATVTAGRTTTIKATISNLDTSRTITSATLTAPAGLTVVSATPGSTGGTATVVGSVIQLKTISIPKGTSRDLTIALRAPTSAAAVSCAAKDYTWPNPTAKGSGDDSTTFAFRAAGSDLRTRVTQTCALRFSTQPADADPNAAITGTAFDPLGPPVAVEVIDASATRVTVSGTPVTVGLGANPGPGVLSGATAQTTANGVATFTGLSIDASAIGYTLSATSSGIAPATSSAFTIVRSIFSLKVSGPGGSAAAVPTGSTAPLELTLRNTSGGRPLGSADVPLPAGLTVVSASVPSGTATVSGGVLQLRGLGVAPGGSVTVSLSVTTPCATSATSLTWPTPSARPTADFNGSVTFVFDSGASALGTDVTGVCTLHFLTAPADASAGKPITGVAYNTSGPAVMVEVLTADGTRATTSGSTVTTALGAGGGPGTLSGTATAGTVTGVATFADLSIDQRGSYTLGATSSDATAVTSGPFTIESLGIACAEDVTCSGTVQLPTSQVNVQAVEGPTPDTDAGTLTVAAGVGGNLDCAFYTEVGGAQDVVAIDYSAPDRRKIVTTTFPTYAGSPSSLQVCFGAPYKFATKFLTPIKVNTDYVPGPYPAPEYKGLLPNCGALANLDDPDTWWIIESVFTTSAGPPCVQSRAAVTGGGASITSLLPSGTDVGSSADPRTRS